MVGLSGYGSVDQQGRGGGGAAQAARRQQDGVSVRRSGRGRRGGWRGKARTELGVCGADHVGLIDQGQIFVGFGQWKDRWDICVLGVCRIYVVFHS